ncbi:MAG: tripartite tricarboxylate transporter TctB family protein [Gammaproteobacteria bacterium]|nr:tripartite tricarboxylate transporter TctB family protein [Gammaproteobacteria bacterium]
MPELFTVTIDFEQSHLFFPHIIHWMLLLMVVLILVFEAPAYLRRLRAGHVSLPFTRGPFDAVRFMGTLLLTVVYFLTMPWVGDFFPNTGLGFLIVSIPYMAALSLLYLHDRSLRQVFLVVLNAVIAPVVAWLVLAKLFAITLP